MLDYPQELNSAFVSRHGDGKNLGSAQRMNLRSELAKKMLSAQYSHLTQELEKKAAEQHEREMSQWNLTLEDLSEAPDVPLCVTLLLSLLGVFNLRFCFLVPATLYLKPFTLSFVRLAPMPIAIFPSLLVMLLKNQMRPFSLRMFNSFFRLGPSLMRRKVFIGGQGIRRQPRVGTSWTQMDSTPELPVCS